MALSVADLKAELQDYNYQMLTGGDDDVASRALAKAVIWAKAKVIAVNGTFDPDTEINRELVLKRALYELYSYAENEAVARDKRDDAFELLKAAYGSGIDSSGYDGSEAKPLAGGTVVKQDRNETLF
ncbi:MAG: hypothetical protein ACPKOP_04065 [Sphaerochaetaceae bacterium]